MEVVEFILYSFFFFLPFVFRTKLSNVSGSLLGSDKHVVKQVFLVLFVKVTCHLNAMKGYDFFTMTLLYTCACLTVVEFVQV